MKIRFEVCCFNAISALNAQKAGADRIELCENYHDGGTTPSYGTIEFVRGHLNIDLFVMIRPRGGGFNYSSDELEIMRKDIKIAKDLGVDGFVLGALTPDGQPDEKALRYLLEDTAPLPLTFHRAFDMVHEPFVALETLIDLGFQRVLTSGLQANSYAGMEMLRKLVEKAEDRIIVMPGGGINTENIREIARYTTARELHFSAKQFIETANDPLAVAGKTIIADEEIIGKMIQAVK